MTASKNIVFDIVGTLVGYDKLYEAIDRRLGDKLRAKGIKHDMFAFTWIEVAEREYTYLSISGRYVKYSEVFEAIFYRVLWKSGIADPRGFASSDDLAAIMKGYREMEMRPGATECIQKLRDGGFTVWGFTMSDLKRVGGYFARSGIEMPPENLMSCDSTGIGKPDPEAYKPVLEKLSKDGSQPWFAAAHMWDVSAARRTGFKGAYCTVWEHEPLLELFGDMDVVADTLPEMADKVVAAS